MQAIDDKAVTVLAFNIISTPDSPSHKQVREMDCLAPPVEKRLAVMEQLSRAGILTGTCTMPVLPALCDDDANPQYEVKRTAEHGGQFVLPCSLTLAEQQRDFFLDVLCERFPALLGLYQSRFQAGS